MKKLELSEIKQIEFDILKKFVDFCDKNQINYSLAYGTLLGCVRHGGFIPWDDDIDVFLPRTDYEKLLSLKDVFENSFKELNFKCLGTKNYPFGFLKITNNETLVEEKEIEKKYRYGIWIDVFPLDKISSNKKKHLKNIKKINFWNKILVKSIIANGNFCDGKKKQIANSFFLIPLSHLIAKIIDIPKLCAKNAEKFNHEKTNLFTNYIWENNTRFPVFDITKIFPTKKGTFEGVEFNIPNDSDNILKTLYGNYMELPPESERVSHLANAWRIK